MMRTLGLLVVFWETQICPVALEMLPSTLKSADGALTVWLLAEGSLGVVAADE